MALHAADEKANEVGKDMDTLVYMLFRYGVVYGESVKEFKKRFITHVMKMNKGNQIISARQLGMHRNTLGRLITELGIDVREAKIGTRKRVSTFKERVTAMSAQVGA
jgi:DNA-binding NtrC family response regulator